MGVLEKCYTNVGPSVTGHWATFKADIVASINCRQYLHYIEPSWHEWGLCLRMLTTLKLTFRGPPLNLQVSRGVLEYFLNKYFETEFS